MRTAISFGNDENAPWSRNNHVMGTRSLPSSDNSNPSQDPWTEIMTNQATLVTELFNYAYLLSPAPSALSV
jgi:hypothetical protein